ncbi:glycosyltransferase [Thermosynechococcus sp. QKsg1]|uniref:glycosyltransferase n=1 Tax=Thermosynechococcus sp. QKsg1 TaxID=3074130 RepID=UPI0028778D80|nr:glycosyltransferase [Thermosynechococcus sp. QKsg1]WNC86767.1 glycosyltransferase [Thermosynechococcus sp. QKsg1]
MKPTQPTLSIITATYNAEEHLPRLIASLIAQTDQDFEWVVADGGSTDRTLELIEAAKAELKAVVVDSRPDFGIYDALNRAVCLASGDYYVVMGADDELFPEAVAQYKIACEETEADFVTANYYIGERDIAPVWQPAWEWLKGMQAHVTSHAVGLAIRRTLHQRVGQYSHHFPIAADQLFVMQAIRAGARVARRDFIAGRFHPHGTSGSDPLGSIVESYRVQVRLGHSLLVQTLLLFYRIIRCWPRIQQQRSKFLW